MIGIMQNKNLTDYKMKTILNWHWKKIKELKSSKKYATSAGKTFDDLQKDLIAIDPKYTLEYICKAPYGELSVIAAKLHPHYTKINAYVKKGKSGKHLTVALYEEFREKYGRELVEKLGISVCPYCNRNFINNGKDRAMAQFDHFLDKGQNPIFAVSFYNLIPCCSACNLSKGTKPIKISPYDTKYTTDELLTFGYFPIKYNKNKITINCINPDMNSNVCVFQLEEQYQIHSDLILQLEYKAKQKCKTYIASINKNLPAYLKMSEEELYFGNYFSEDKYYLRPLSKFTKDIVNEIKSKK